MDPPQNYHHYSNQTVQQIDHQHHSSLPIPLTAQAMDHNHNFQPVILHLILLGHCWHLFPSASSSTPSFKIVHTPFIIEPCQAS